MKNVRRPLRNLLVALLIISSLVLSVFADSFVPGEESPFDLMLQSSGLIERDTGNEVTELYTNTWYSFLVPGGRQFSRVIFTVTALGFPAGSPTVHVAKDGNAELGSGAGYTANGRTYRFGFSVPSVSTTFSKSFDFMFSAPDSGVYTYTLQYCTMFYSEQFVPNNIYAFNPGETQTRNAFPATWNEVFLNQSGYDGSNLPTRSYTLGIPVATSTYQDYFVANVLTGDTGYKSCYAYLKKSDSTRTYVPVTLSSVSGTAYTSIFVDLLNFEVKNYAYLEIVVTVNPSSVKVSDGNFSWYYNCSFYAGAWGRRQQSLPWYQQILAYLRSIAGLDSNSKIDDDPAISDVSGGIDNIQSGAQGAIDAALPGVTSDITTISGNLAGGVSFLTRYVTGVFDGMGDIKILFLLPFFIGILMHIWGRVPNSSAVKTRLKNNKSPSDKPNSGGDKSL